MQWMDRAESSKQPLGCLSLAGLSLMRSLLTASLLVEPVAGRFSVDLFLDAVIRSAGCSG